MVVGPACTLEGVADAVAWVDLGAEDAFCGEPFAELSGAAPTGIVTDTVVVDPAVKLGVLAIGRELNGDGPDDGALVDSAIAVAWTELVTVTWTDVMDGASVSLTIGDGEVGGKADEACGVPLGGAVLTEAGELCVEADGVTLTTIKEVTELAAGSEFAVGERLPGCAPGF